MNVLKQSPKAAVAVAAFLKKGGVVICPTDTVYGFLADATNKAAADKIFEIKKRPKSKPLSLFVKNIASAQEVALIDESHEKMLKRFWPGKYTFVFPRNSKKVLYGVHEDTIAIRIPDYPFLNDVLKKVNRPLVQTSTNISGKKPLDSISDIIKQFGRHRIVIVDGGDLKEGKASKIIDAITNKIIRA
jgi:L-threonylcarbamoyladenylate synthase